MGDLVLYVLVVSPGKRNHFKLVFCFVLYLFKMVTAKIVPMRSAMCEIVPVPFSKTRMKMVEWEGTDLITGLLQSMHQIVGQAYRHVSCVQSHIIHWLPEWCGWYRVGYRH